MFPRSNEWLIAMSLLSLIAAGCSRQRLEDSPEYQAACHGPPLRTLKLRNEALENSYEINRQYDCIDRGSFESLRAEEAERASANTPEAIARRREERAKMMAEERARRAAIEYRQRAEPAIPALRLVDVNTATETELASVATIGPEIAAQIVEQRSKGRFENWPDLINRVVGLSSAQNAIYASVSGLIVDGHYLPGAPPDAGIAAAMSDNYQKH